MQLTRSGRGFGLGYWGHVCLLSVILTGTLLSFALSLLSFYGLEFTARPVGGRQAAASGFQASLLATSGTEAVLIAGSVRKRRRSEAALASSSAVQSSWPKNGAGCYPQLTAPLVPPMYPGECAPDKAIVVAFNTEDISWLSVYFPHIPHYVYAANTTDAIHQLPAWYTREAGAFLQFIIDHYENLPATMAFIHGHRNAYHTWKQDMVYTLRRLKWGEIKGYTPLNLKEFQRLEPAYENWGFILKYWDLFFKEVGPAPPADLTGRAYCCAQFAVRREDILRRSKAFYMRLQQMVLTKRRWDGPRILEHSWHFIMGAPLVMKKLTQEEICGFMDCSIGEEDGPVYNLDKRVLREPLAQFDQELRVIADRL